MDTGYREFQYHLKLTARGVAVCSVNIAAKFKFVGFRIFVI